MSITIEDEIEILVETTSKDETETIDLKAATLFIDGKEYSVTDSESLKWIEDSFRRADELKGWPNCPYDAELVLVREDGASFKIQVATDSCNNLKAGDICSLTACGGRETA